MTNCNHVHLITLGITDLARARRFYETVFGWPVSSASAGDVVFFKSGRVVVALYPAHKLAADAGVAASGAGGHSGVALAHNVSERDDVTRILTRAASAGGRITRAAQDAFWGGHSGYFADLDGHLWEIAWNPGFPFAPDGALSLP